MGQSKLQTHYAEKDSIGIDRVRRRGGEIMKPGFRAFWWAPSRSPRLALPEITSEASTWLRLTAATGRPLMNFGDELTPLILERLLGRTVRWAPPVRADIVAVGSILELSTRRPTEARIWGTGARSSDADASFILGNITQDAILAVRGPRTVSALGLSDLTPVGDPGVFAPYLLDGRRTPKRGTIFVPHFRTWSTRSGRDAMRHLKSLNVSIVEPSAPPLKVIRAIASADFVLSSSLHGAIVSHALGIPAQLISVQGRNSEPAFKYDDFYESCHHRASIVPADSLLDLASIKRLLEHRAAEASALEKSAGKLAESLRSAISVLD